MTPDGLDAVRRIELESHASETGALIPVEEDGAIPFTVERAFFVRDVPAGGTRGGHAYRTTDQVVVPILGRLRVEASDRAGRRVTYDLAPGEHAAVIPPGIWLETTALDDGTVFAVLSSRPFDCADAVRDREAFEAGDAS